MNLDIKILFVIENDEMIDFHHSINSIKSVKFYCKAAPLHLLRIYIFTKLHLLLVSALRDLVFSDLSIKEKKK